GTYDEFPSLLLFDLDQLDFESNWSTQPGNEEIGCLHDPQQRLGVAVDTSDLLEPAAGGIELGCDLERYGGVVLQFVGHGGPFGGELRVTFALYHRPMSGIGRTDNQRRCFRLRP